MSIIGDPFATPQKPSPSARSSIPLVLFRNKLTAVQPNPLRPRLRNSVVNDPYLSYNPLPKKNHELLRTDQAKTGFLQYLKGDLNEEELMFIKNFPTLYENLPEPRKTYLQIYIRESKGEYTQTQPDMRGVNSDDDPNVDDEDDYMDEEEFRLRLTIQQSKSSREINSVQSIDQKPQKKPMKTVGFATESLTDLANQQKNKVQHQQQSSSSSLLSRKSTILDSVDMMRKQSQAGMKTLLEVQAEKQQRRIMQMRINGSLNNLRKKIMDNVALRKNLLDPTDPAAAAGVGNSDSQSQTATNKNVYLNTKFFTQLAGIHDHMQEKITQRDRSSGITSADDLAGHKKSFVRRSLKNLSIITKRSGTLPSSPSSKSSNIQSSYGLKSSDVSGSSTHRIQQKSLYKRYFDENADSFIRLLHDPYGPKMRNTLKTNDEEYNKFVASYFTKALQRRTSVTSVGSTTMNNNLSGGGQMLQSSGSMSNLDTKKTNQAKKIAQFSFEGRDLLTLNKELSAKERRLIDSIGDLDKFSEKHIIDSISGACNNVSEMKKSTKAATPVTTTTTVKLAVKKRQNINRNPEYFSNSKVKPKLQNVSYANTSLTTMNTTPISEGSLVNRIEKKDRVSTKQSTQGSFITKDSNQLEQIPTALSSTHSIKDKHEQQSHHSNSISNPNNNHNNSQTNNLKNNNSSSNSNSNAIINVNNNTSNGITGSNNNNNNSNHNVNQPPPAGSTKQADSSPQVSSLAQQRQEKFQEKGYYIIRRNQSEQRIGDVNISMNEDLYQFEVSDDSSNASRTEAKLDALYSESIAIQNRVVQQDNQEGLIRKLKSMIKLEEIRKNMIDVNQYKLLKR